MILAGDIGGTKTNIALLVANAGQRRPSVVREHSYPSRDYPALEHIVREFLAGETSAPDIEGACFGIAGPVVTQVCRSTNLPWVIEAAAMAASFGIPRVTLINDLEATAEGIAALDPNELETLSAGTPPTELAPAAVVAAGTGLGMAQLLPQDGEWIPAASEGGHVDFAPRNTVEMDLLHFMLKRHQRVSVERIVSGPGLHALYDFFRSRPSASPNPELAQAIAADPAEAPGLISTAALEKRCPVCVQALDQFVICYGACAGNVGLTTLSSGGMYLGGGIPPKILPKLRDGTFLSAFTHKGRLSSVLETMPVHVMLNPKAALLGAARRALRDLRG